jgi:hypothetical protein
MIEQVHEETMQVTVDAIAKIATETASDRKIFATLTVTNAKLAAQLETSQAYINKFKKDCLPQGED